jgi:hypothetical protein
MLMMITEGVVRVPQLVLCCGCCRQHGKMCLNSFYMPVAGRVFGGYSWPWSPTCAEGEATTHLLGYCWPLLAWSCLIVPIRNLRKVTASQACTPTTSCTVQCHRGASLCSSTHVPPELPHNHMHICCEATHGQQHTANRVCVASMTGGNCR